MINHAQPRQETRPPHAHARRRAHGKTKRTAITKSVDVSGHGEVTEMVGGEMSDESVETNAAMLSVEEPIST